MRRRDTGFTVVEVIVVVAILGILLSISFVALPSGGPRSYANDLRALVQQSRYEAVKRNTPVAVVWVPESNLFESRLWESGSFCGGSTVVAARSLAEYPRLSITTTFAPGEGIVWLPSGQARSCMLGTFAQTIATITDGRTERSVTVTLTGRVEVE